MADKLLADANPEKRLFISLITRDIGLADALLDLIDNSINAALEPLAGRLKTADDYQRILTDGKIKPAVKVELFINEDKVEIKDNAGGISAKTAEEHVFKFGRAEGEGEEHDRLSVYGIGLKRAMFKLGRRINMISDHAAGGFSLDLDVRRWEKITALPWTFEIERRAPAKGRTEITVTRLNPDVVTRIKDGVFLEQFLDRVSRTYAFFLGRIVEIEVNGTKVESFSFKVGDNFANEKFNHGGVSCNITAGISADPGRVFRDKNAGWFVFCNGRAVVFADKSMMTGWGSGLPIFQPKHRPFLGTVFFVSSNPEALPWTTTKGGINQESAIWQLATKHMITAGRIITSFLDRRYSDDGTEIPTADLKGASGSTVSVLTAAVAPKRVFVEPQKPPPAEIKIQFMAKVVDIEKIEGYLKRPGMGGAAVGRYVFDFFLRNEVKQ